MIFSHGFYYLWSGMMIGLNLGVVIAVVLGWLYLFLRLVLYFLFKLCFYSLPMRYYVILYFSTIYLLFIIIGIFGR